MKTKHFLALLALTGGALSAQATIITAGLNDIILGFRVTSATSPGVTTNLEVNLGSVAQFYNVGSNTGFFVTGLNVNDLSNTYGASWNSRNDLTWGVAGASGLSATTIAGNSILGRTLWAGAAESTLGTQSTPWLRGSSSAQSAPRNTIQTLYTGASGSLNGATSSTLSSTTALIDNSLSGSWSKQEGTSGAAFGYFDTSLFENSTNIAGSFAATDLYELQPASGSPNAVYLGTFVLRDNGDLSFGGSYAAATTVPEPSTYAAILGAVTLGFVAVRRRQRPAKA